MCQVLNVSRSSFYAWRGHVDSAATARRGELAALITRAFEDSRHTYGCRRITVALNRQGHACSVGLVADLMRALGLKAVQPRSYRITTIQGDEHPDIEDGINRDFTAVEPGTRLVGDITYLRTDQGWHPEFKESSQHPDIEVVGDGRSGTTASGARNERSNVVAGSTIIGAA